MSIVGVYLLMMRRYKKLIGIGVITLVSQLIAFALMPVLTRIYGPTIYGEYSILLSVILLFTMLSTLNIQQDITKGGKVKYKYKVSSMYLFSSTFSFVILLITLLLLYWNLIAVQYIYISISVFFVSIYQVYYFSLLRLKRYKELTIATSCLLVSLPVFQIVFHYILGKQLSSLVLSHCLSIIISLSYMYCKLGLLDAYRGFGLKCRASFFLMKNEGSKYFKITVGRFLQLLNLQIPILITSIYLKIEDVAVIALSLKLVEVIARLIRNTVGNYILAENTVGKSSVPTYSQILTKYKVFFGFSTLFVILYITAAYYIVDLIFGADWQGLSMSLLILTPYFFANLVTSVFYYMMNIVKINSEMYLLELLLLFILISFFYVGYLSGLGILYVLLVMSISYFLYSLIMLALIAKKVRYVRV